MNIYQKYKSDYRTNFKLALPIMIGQLGQVAVNIADNVMVGHLGPEAIASVGLSIAIFAVFIIFGMGISFALPPLVAEADGKGDRPRISHLYKHSLVINIIYAIVAMSIMIIALPLLHHIGQVPEVVELAYPYIELSAFSLLPYMLFQTYRTLSDGKSETLPPMIAMITGNIINIGLNYILIFGKWGAPELGVYGAALSSLISRIIMVLLLIVILRYWKDIWFYIKEANYRSYKWPTFKKLLGIGIPTSFQTLFEILAFSGSTILMGQISAEAQAAHQIALNLITVTFMVCIGISVAATIRVGNQLGKGKLILAAIFQIPDGVQAVSIGALRGLQDIRIPTIVTFIAYIVIGLPLAWTMAFIFNWGPQGIWTGLMAGLFTAAILNTWRFHIVSRQLLIE